jgi:hypothetical protein
MPVKFLQKQEGPQGPILRSCEGLSRAEVSKTMGDFNESRNREEQRITAENSGGKPLFFREARSPRASISAAEGRFPL